MGQVSEGRPARAAARQEPGVHALGHRGRALIDGYRAGALIYRSPIRPGYAAVQELIKLWAEAVIGRIVVRPGAEGGHEVVKHRILAPVVAGARRDIFTTLSGTRGPLGRH